MKVSKDGTRLNVYNLTEVDDVIEKVLKYIKETKTIDIEENSIVDLMLNMIAFEIVNELKGKIGESADVAMSAPIVRVSAEILNKFSYVLTQDLYITITTIDASNNLYGYAIL